eukprot:377392-Rhodomonas_salina.1
MPLLGRAHRVPATPHVTLRSRSGHDQVTARSRPGHGNVMARSRSWLGHGAVSARWITCNMWLIACTMREIMCNTWSITCIMQRITGVPVDGGHEPREAEAQEHVDGVGPGHVTCTR